jgi:hypothetical protein
MVDVVGMPFTKKAWRDWLGIPNRLFGEKNRQMPLRGGEDIKEHVELNLSRLLGEVMREVGKMGVEIFCKIGRVGEATLLKFRTNVSVLIGMITDQDKPIINKLPGAQGGGVGKVGKVENNLFPERDTPEKVGVNKIMTAGRDMVADNHTIVRRRHADLINIIEPIPTGKIRLGRQRSKAAGPGISNRGGGAESIKRLDEMKVAVGMRVAEDKVCGCLLNEEAGRVLIRRVVEREKTIEVNDF